MHDLFIWDTRIKISHLKRETKRMRVIVKIKQRYNISPPPQKKIMKLRFNHVKK